MSPQLYVDKYLGDMNYMPTMHENDMILPLRTSQFSRWDTYVKLSSKIEVYGRIFRNTHHLGFLRLPYRVQQTG